MIKRFWILALPATVVFAVACGGGQTATNGSPAETTVPPAPETQQGEPAAQQGVAEEDDSDQAAAPEALALEGGPAPKLANELAGISGWINSEPLTLADQLGKVVLIDFWTYTCVNCIRTLPYLRSWQEKYAGVGLVIIGVHTPEFEFEKIRDNVVDAAEEHGLEYAIAQDNDFATWQAFDNHAWPAKYLIDKEGLIRYQHFGEGSYVETEAKIRELLAEAGADLAGIPPGSVSGPTFDPFARTADPMTSLTRELYAGYERNFGAMFSGQTPPYILDRRYFARQDIELLYDDPGDHDNHFLYLQGLWNNGAESIEHARATGLRGLYRDQILRP